LFSPANFGGSNAACSWHKAFATACFAAFRFVLEKLWLAFVSLYKNWPPGPINSKMRKDSVTAQRQRMNFVEA
jgi:hypothetical protein